MVIHFVRLPDFLTKLKVMRPTVLVKQKSEDINLKQIVQSARIRNKAEHAIHRNTDELPRFPEPDTISNQNMRRVLDQISVNRDGNVRIVLKKFEDMENS